MTPEPAKEDLQDPTQELWRVAETDDTERVESLLASGGDINARNPHGMTALMRAAACGRVKMVRALLNLGADPNTSRNDKFTPLMLAAFFGHEEIVKVLVEHGAETGAASRFGTSAQMWAMSRTFQDLAHYLRDPSVNPIPAGESAEAGESQIDVAPEPILGDGDLKPRTRGIAALNSPEEAAEILELAFARLGSEGQNDDQQVELPETFQSNDTPAEVQEPLESSDDVARVDPLKGLDWQTPLVSRIQPLSRRPVAYALTTFLLFAVAFVLLHNEQKTEVPSQAASSVALDDGAVKVRPAVEPINIAPSETQWLAADADSQVSKPTNNQTENQSKNQTTSPAPTAAPKVVSMFSKEASGKRSRFENTDRNTSSVIPIPASSSEELRIIEPAPVDKSQQANASPAKSQPALARDSAQMKKPQPQTTQLLSGSKTSPSGGKVIQWP